MEMMLRRICKSHRKLAVMKLICRNITFEEKGKAEENIYHLKEQRIALMRLKKRLLLEEKIVDKRLRKNADDIKRLEQGLLTKKFPDCIPEDDDCPPKI